MKSRKEEGIETKYEEKGGMEYIFVEFSQLGIEWFLDFRLSDLILNKRFKSLVEMWKDKM